MKTVLLTCIVLHGLAVAQAAEISGTVRLLPGPLTHDSTIIVYAEATDSKETPKPGTFKIVQRDKTFVPHVLAVPVGSTVSFPNSDPIFHNVFSLSPPAPFDLGLYRAGSTKTLQFNTPTTYRIFCNIHPQMTALLLVLPTSSFVQADANGRYHLQLDSGSYRLTAWSERSQPVTVAVTVGSGALRPPDITLDESQFKEMQHKNKYGQDYPKAAYTQNK